MSKVYSTAVTISIQCEYFGAAGPAAQGGPCKKPPLNISIVQFIGICNFDALIADF